MLELQVSPLTDMQACKEPLSGLALGALLSGPLSEPSKPKSVPSYLEARERYLPWSLAQVFRPTSLSLTMWD